MKPDQSDLILVHSVCNIAYQSISTYKLADDNCHEWQEKC